MGAVLAATGCGDNETGSGAHAATGDVGMAQDSGEDDGKAEDHGGDYGQFWENAEVLFGVALETDKGLNLADPAQHNGLSGLMVVVGDHFEVHGIPVTPIDDALTHDPYQVAEITVRNNQGVVLGQTQATVPTSDEINCSNCHGEDAFRDILVKHPRVDGKSLLDMQPVLCASCHASTALGSPAGQRGSAGTYVSEVMHGSHADRTDPLENPITCYDCHPGPQTKCHRSIAHLAPSATTADWPHKFEWMPR